MLELTNSYNVHVLFYCVTCNILCKMDVCSLYQCQQMAINVSGDQSHCCEEMCVRTYR